MLNIKSAASKRLSKWKGKRRFKQLTQGHKSWKFLPRLQNEAVVLHSILPAYDILFFEDIIQHFRDLISSYVQNHGFNGGSKKYNVLKQYTIELIEFRNPENPGFFAVSRVHKIPSVGGKNFSTLLVDYFLEDNPTSRAKYYQAIITILNISRIVEGLTSADFASVEEKSKPIDEDLLLGFTTYVEKALEPHVYIPEKVYLSTYKTNYKKKGPSGKPKLESAPEEAILLLKDKSLSQPFRVICSALGVSYLISYMEALVSQTRAKVPDDSNENLKEAKLRKLVTVADSGFKTRIVAIVDFWSQLVLEPIRHYVQLVTKKLYVNTDFRVNQDRGVKSMVEFQRKCLNKEKIGSHELNIKYLKFYDFSSWTDRYHRDLQKIVMCKLFGPKLAQAWAQLTVHCAWSVPFFNRTVKYGQGQGMGTNGSFDIATLTDHLFINFMYSDIYVSNQFIGESVYGKVGDDLWIYDPEDKVPYLYEKINLPINMSKSKLYGELGSIAEFCSRTFINGIDSSRISPKLISKSKDFRYLPLLLSYCASRGIHLDRLSFTYLENKIKGSEELYLDKLQPWILSTFVEPSDAFASLDFEYLEKGSWLTDAYKSVLQDQVTLDRIRVARCIVQVLNSYSDIKTKMWETRETPIPIPSVMFSMVPDTKSELYDTSEASQFEAEEFFGIEKGNVYSPKEIFILNRYCTQSDLLFEQFRLALSEYNPGDPTTIIGLRDRFQDLSQRSVFDRGNVNYDTKAIYTAQYEIVNFLKRMDSTYTVLTLTTAEIGLLSHFIADDALYSGLFGILTINAVTSLPE